MAMTEKEIMTLNEKGVKLVKVYEKIKEINSAFYEDKELIDNLYKNFTNITTGSGSANSAKSTSGQMKTEISNAEALYKELEPKYKEAINAGYKELESEVKSYNNEKDVFGAPIHTEIKGIPSFNKID